MVERIIREKGKQLTKQSVLGAVGNRMWYREYLE